MNFKTRFTALLCVVAWSLIWAITPARALDDDPLAVSRGLDVVVLVDVSGSMSLIKTANETVKGSDPEQLRWDAVKLVVDLLSREDHLLVRRFNHACPPGLDKQTPEFRKDIQTFFKYDSQKDDDAFQLLETAKDRLRFADKVKFFGATGKGSSQGYFDFGGTGIINALQKSGPQISRGGDGRQKVVILLTDGLDDRYASVSASELLARWDREEQKLRSELPAYVPASRSNSSVRTYTFGLNLDATKSFTGEDRVTLSRRLLSSLAAMNGGDFQDIQDSGGLVAEFQKLIWSLKECWRRDFSVAAGQPFEVQTYVRPDIVDVGILAWEQDPTRTGPKNTNPPTGGIQPKWPADVAVPEPTRSKGKEDAVYEYMHWEGVKKAGGADGTGNLYASPFETLNGPVELSVGLKESPHPRNVSISKRTGVRLFHVVRPRADEQFNRFQGLQLEVAMAAMVDFHPGQFQVTAQLFSEGGGRKPPLKEVELTHDGKRGFIGRLPLRELSYNNLEPFTYYSLGFLVQGLEVDQNPLGGFRLELPRRTIRVDNQLVLKPLKAVVLSRKVPAAEVILEADGTADALALYDDLTLPVQFFVPSFKGETLLAKHFQFEPGADFQQGKITLKAGRATFKLGLNKDDIPLGGRTYMPGSLRIPAVPEFRFEQRQASIGLSIDLERIAIIPDTIELTVDRDIVRSPAINVSFDQKQNAERQIKVSLTPRLPDGATAPKVKFDPSELWIEITDKPVEANQRQQSIEVDSKSSFVVAVHPTSSKPTGSYLFDLKVEGEGIDPDTSTVKVFVEPPSLTLLAQELTVYATPGSTHEARIQCRLKSNQRDDRELLQVQGGGRAAKFKFTNASQSDNSVQIPLDSPGKDDPFQIEGQPEGEWTEIPLTLKIPARDVAPFGRYDTVLKLVGERVPMQEVTIHVVINDLRIEWPFTVKGQVEPAWRPVESRRLLQFLEDADGMKKKIRIRTELNDPLDPKDVQVQFLTPFVDGIGDPQQLPHIIDKQVLSGEQHGLEIELGFDRVVNFNQPGRDKKAANQKGVYTVMFRVNLPTLHIPERTTKFTVQYLKQDDLVGE